MARRIYRGPVHAIETKLDGIQMIVERGQAVDVSDETAAVLDQCPENWATPRVSAPPAPPKTDDVSGQ